MAKLFSQLKDAGSELSEEEKINYILLSMPQSLLLTIYYSTGDI